MDNCLHPLDDYLMEDVASPSSVWIDDIILGNPEVINMNPYHIHFQDPTTAPFVTLPSRPPHEIPQISDDQTVELINKVILEISADGKKDPQRILQRILDLNEVKRPGIVGSGMEHVYLYLVHLANALEKDFFGVNTATCGSHEAERTDPMTIISSSIIASSFVIIKGYKMTAKLILVTARKEMDAKNTTVQNIIGILDMPTDVGTNGAVAPVSPTPTLRQDFNQENCEQGGLKLNHRPMCTECRATFSNLAMLNRHEKTVHADADGTWNCGACGARFTNKTTLTKHCKKIH